MMIYRAKSNRTYSARFVRAMLPVFLLSIPSALRADDESVQYDKAIAPVLTKNCVACHNANRAEGGLNLESYETLMQGGDSGDAIVADNLDDSYLFARVSGAEEPLMPPEDNDVGAHPLSESELRLLQDWILAGAKGSDSPMERAIQWQTPPASLKPIYTLAASDDGQFLAYGYGNSVIVAPQDTNQAAAILVDPSLPTPQAHLDLVQSLAISPDSQRIATGGYRSVKIWRRASDSQTQLAGLSESPTHVVFSPNRQKIASAKSTALEIVDLQSGVAERFLKSHVSPITGLTWLDDHRVLSCDSNGGWNITDANASQSLRIFDDASSIATTLITINAQTAIAMKSDGTLLRITFANQDGNDLSPAVEPLSGFDDVVSIAAAGAETNSLMIARRSGTIQWIDPISGEETKRFQCEQPVQAAFLDQSADRLVAITNSGGAQLWDLTEGKQIANLNQDYRELQIERFVARDVNRQKSRLAAIENQLPEQQKALEKEIEARKKTQEARDKAAEELVARNQELEAANATVAQGEQALAIAQAAVQAAAKQVEEANADLEAKKKAVAEANQRKLAAEQELAKREQALASASDSTTRAENEIPQLESLIKDEKARLVVLEESLATASQASLQSPTIQHVAFLTDQRQLVIAAEDQMLRVFSMSDGHPTANLPTSGSTAAIVPDQHGQLLAYGDDGQLRSWNLEFPWVLEHTLGNDRESPFSDRIAALDFSPDGKLLAVGSGPPSRFGDLKLIDVATMEVAHDFGEVHSDTILSVRYSPDGRQLASAAADKMCKLYEVASGAFLRSFEGHTHHVLGVAWSDSGVSLATASADASIKVWRADTGEQIRTIGGFSKEVSALQFVGNTNQIASCSVDGTVRLHNADDGKQLRGYAGASDALFGITISSDGKRVSVGGQLGKIWTWQIDDAQLLTQESK